LKVKTLFIIIGIALVFFSFFCAWFEHKINNRGAYYDDGCKVCLKRRKEK